MFSIFDGPDANCVLLSTRPHVIARMVEVFEENEASIHQVGSYEALERTLSADKAINFILIDVDSVSNLAAQIGYLRHLREAHPDKAAILMSDEFETNEFGTLLMKLADVSLRTPVLDAFLEMALLQARENNLVWCQRFDAMRQDCSLQGREMLVNP